MCMYDLIASYLWFVLMCVLPVMLTLGPLIIVAAMLSMVSRQRSVDRMRNQRRAGVEPSQP